MICMLKVRRWRGHRFRGSPSGADAHTSLIHRRGSNPSVENCEFEKRFLSNPEGWPRMQLRITGETFRSAHSAEHESLSIQMQPHFLAANSDKTNSKVASFDSVLAYNNNNISAELECAENDRGYRRASLLDPWQ